MKDNLPLYNSRIIKIYLSYISRYYSSIDIDALLEYAEITKYEVEDPGHWFNQAQTDRFQEIAVLKTGNPNISREAGRYAASSNVLGVVKQYIMGLMSISSVYQLVGKEYSIMSRGAIVKAKRTGLNKVEIESAPKPEISEKPYQCENRMGTLESLAKLFTNQLATIEHPSCYHRGDTSCRYIITWEKTSSIKWKLLRNTFLLLSVLVSLSLFFVLPLIPWAVLVQICVFLTLILSLFYKHYEKKELTRIIETQGDSAKDHLHEINIRHNNALLVQEIGHAISTVLDIDSLTKIMMKIMEQRLDFDRGMIMLGNREKTRLSYTAGYGYSKKQEEHLRRIKLHLDDPKLRKLLVSVLQEHKPISLIDIAKIDKKFFENNPELAEQMDIESRICIPIIYEKQPLGMLVADSIKHNRPYTESDINLLIGVASQLAVCIINVMSFQRLQESEEKYRTLLEANPDPVVVFDVEGKIIYLNPAFSRVFGWTVEDFSGKGMDLFVPKEDMHETRIMIDKMLAGESYSGIEKIRFTKEGERIPVSISGSIYRDSNSALMGSVMTLRDISKQKQLESQLRQVQKMEAIGSLAGGIAHDFNNILHPIIGYTEIIMDDVPEKSIARRNLNRIFQAANRAKDLVKQILTFSRQTEKERKPILIQSVVEEACALLRSSIPKNIEIRQNIDAHCESVLADPVQVHQIVMNLCTNAYHAMREKGGTLEVNLLEEDIIEEDYLKAKPDLSPGRYVKLTVSDTGPGIDKTIIKRIFDPYFTTKAPGEGTGMGLAVVHGIVKSHDGDIEVYSEPGKATKFHVYLPIIETGSGKAENMAKEPLQRGSERVLLVDDEEQIVRLTQRILENLGYHATPRTSSIEALEAFRANPDKFDLVITDMTMPNMTGAELALELIKIRSDIPIILCTGFSETMDEKRSKAVGIREYLMKPFARDEIARTIRKVLDDV